MTTKNLVSDFGAVGDAQRQTVNITVTSGSATLTVGTAVFVVGDIGKKISIWDGNNTKTGATISGFTSSTVVTLNSNFSWNSTASSSDVLWGTDNTSAFTGASGSWRAFAQTQTDTGNPPILEIPDGSYYWIGSQAAGGTVHYNVLNNPTIRSQSGNPANCKLMQGNTGELRFGTDPMIAPNAGIDAPNGLANSVRLQTASAGASSVFVVSHGTYGSRVVVGRSVLIAAYDMQGLNNSFFGYPPNSYFYEHNKITAYNSGTGEVTLETPLTQEYKSTYPEWGDRTTIFGSDQGGPATMWIGPDGYGFTVTVEGVTIDSPHNQSGCAMRHVVLNNCVMNGPGLYPSVNDTFTATDCVYPQQLEVDKMTGTVTWNNCTLNRLQQQSASPNRMILNGGSIQILETAKYTEANNVAFTGTAKLSIGVTSYGRAERAVINNCADIATFTGGGATLDDLDGTATGAAASTFFTFVGGVIKILKTENDSAGGTGQQNFTRIFIPGTWISFDNKYLDRVSDVYEDGTYCYIQFANTTDWPFTPVSRLSAHPCPDFTMNSCTGTAPELEDWNAAPARRPLWSYSKRTYVAGASAATPQTSRPYLLGRLVTGKFTPISLYTGASLTYSQNQFNNWPLRKTDYTTYSSSSLTGIINMKVGLNTTRTLLDATAPTGSQSGDTLTDYTSVGSVWFMGASNSYPVFSANVSNGDTPTIVVEFITDQGIPAAVPTAVVPLRLRLRA
jgi:hypothetical protein